MKNYFKVICMLLTATVLNLSALTVTPYSKTELKYKEKNEELFKLYREAFDILNIVKSSGDTLNRAYEKLNKILEQDPEYAPAYREMTRLLIGASQPEKAFYTMLRAIELEPAYENAYVLLGFQYMVEDELDKAKESLQRAKKLGSKLPWLDLNWAMIYEKEENYKEAKKRYYKVFNSKTTNLYAYHYAFQGVVELEIISGNNNLLQKLFDEYEKHKEEVAKSMLK